MARKTIFVSDFSGKEIDESSAQTVRFKSDRVELVLTAYGEQLRDRPTSSEEDWDSYWENLKTS